MTNKLRFLTLVTLVSFVILNIFSCSSDDEVALANLSVTVQFSDNFTGLSSEGLTVTLTNTTDQGEIQANTATDGIATFINIAPGTYNISCSRNLTAEEASSASGYYEEITLNGVNNNVILVGGIQTEQTLILDGKPSSSLVIKEFYYSGANDPNYSILFKDQFVEIYNNSDEVVYADGLYLASLAPSACGSDASDVALPLSKEEFVYADKVARIPGDGDDYPVQPGESIVIAFNAVDWTSGGENSEITVDLSSADFELYAVDWLESLGRQGNTWFDIDNTDVTNMDMIYLNIENYGQFSFLSTGASIAIFNSETVPAETVTDPNSSESNPIYYLKIRVEDIVDGIDMLFNSEAAAFKRLPSSIDAGFNFVEGNSYTSKSVRRKVAKTTADGRKILQDTNNSTNDFDAIDLPTPRGFGE